MWGGRTKDFLGRKSELASSVYSFDQFLEFWAENETSGVPPPGLYTGACASAGHHVYVYGGDDGSHFQGSLHQLDTRSWTWKQLSSDGPMSKRGCGMMAHDSKLVLFGGHGVPSGPTQPGAEFVNNSRATDGGGWTNELHVFGLNKGMGGCILLSILQHTLHGIECLHASFCRRNGGHFGAQLPMSPTLPILPYFYENSTAKVNCVLVTSVVSGGGGGWLRGLKPSPGGLLGTRPIERLHMMSRHNSSLVYTTAAILMHNENLKLSFSKPSTVLSVFSVYFRSLSVILTRSAYAAPPICTIA